MIRVFCDLCGQEMQPGERSRITRKLERVAVEVMTAVDAVWNGGHVCRSCILRVVNEGQDTTRDNAFVTEDSGA